MDDTELLLIGAGVIYFLAQGGGKTLENLNNIGSTTTESLNNITTGASYLWDLSTMQFTGKNPFTPDVPSIYSSDYWTQYIPQQLDNSWNTIQGWFT